MAQRKRGDEVASACATVLDQLRGVDASVKLIEGIAGSDTKTDVGFLVAAAQAFERSTMALQNAAVAVIKTLQVTALNVEPETKTNPGLQRARDLKPAKALPKPSISVEGLRKYVIDFNKRAFRPGLPAYAHQAIFRKALGLDLAPTVDTLTDAERATVLAALKEAEDANGPA